MNFAHHRRVVFEGSAVAPVQPHTALVAGSTFRVVLLRLVLQDAVRADFKVWPEVRIETYVVDKKLHLQTKNRRSTRNNVEIV